MNKHTLFAVVAAAGLFAVAAPAARAQNTQNAQDPSATAPAERTDRATRTAVRRTTKRTTTVPTAQTNTTTTSVSRTTQATITARNNARLNARLRANERASISNQTVTTRPARLDGGVVRAVRSDNPLQAINPAAPDEYGSGEQVTRHEPDDPFQRPQGLKLVVIEF